MRKQREARQKDRRQNQKNGDITDRQTEAAAPPNSGMAGTLEEAKAEFKGRYAEVKGRT